MIEGPHLKHERIAAVLAREIRSGRVRPGARLPGEVALARRFSVSRTTVRAALAALAAEGLIATRSGKGSFVLYDGRPPDDRIGWAQALARRDVRTRVRVVQLAVAQDHDLARRLELPSPEVVVIQRVCAIEGGDVISMERSCVPAVEGLRDLPRRGLGGNLEAGFEEGLEFGLDRGRVSAVLSAAGLHLDRCEQWLRGRELDAREAELLGRRPGEWFLHSRRVSWTVDDRFVEQLDSLLDPRHFELSLVDGPRPS